MRRSVLILLSALLLLSGMTTTGGAQDLCDPTGLDLTCEPPFEPPFETIQEPPPTEPPPPPPTEPPPTEPPPPPLPTQVPTEAVPTLQAKRQDLYTCDDFQYQEDAQAVYDADPSDPHGLDGQPGPDNDDGLACEHLPSRGTASDGTETNITGDNVPVPVQQPPPAQVPAQQVSACASFDAWEWAQSVFESDPWRYRALDPDADGIACPGLPHGFAPAFWTDRIPQDVEQAKIVRFVDGDTLEVQIRGASIMVQTYRSDTPEIQSAEKCGGEEAAAFAQWVLSWNANPEVVYLERDKNQQDSDGYELAYVWFEVNGDPYMLNHVLLNNGWASDTESDDRKYDQQLNDAAEFAERHDLGLWSLCPGFGKAASSAVTQAPTQEPRTAASATETPGCNVDDSAGTSSQQSVSTSTLDGRVGGTLDSFERVHGAPVENDFFLEYDIEGCGTVFVGDFEGDVVVDIMVFSPRLDEDTNHQKPDDADWTVQEAMQIAESFLPADAILNPPTGDMNPPEPGMLGDIVVVTGTSEQLLERVPSAAYDYVDNSPTYGGFSYALLRTTSGDVSSIVIQLEIEDE